MAIKHLPFELLMGAVPISTLEVVVSIKKVPRLHGEANILYILIKFIEWCLNVVSRFPVIGVLAYRKS